MKKADESLEQEAYLQKIKGMNDEELVEECKKYIGNLESDPMEKCEWKGHFCYVECNNRGKNVLWVKAVEAVWTNTDQTWL